MIWQGTKAGTYIPVSIMAVVKKYILFLISQIEFFQWLPDTLQIIKVNRGGYYAG